MMSGPADAMKDRAVAKQRRLRRGAPTCAAGAWLWAAVVAATSACRGADIDFDCDNQRAAFESVVEDEQARRSTVPDHGPYPMALLLSEDGLNRLLEGQLQGQVPFTGDIAFGPADINFEPEGEPRLELIAHENCRRCVTLTFDFAAELSTLGEPTSAGLGSVSLRIPIALETDGQRSASLVAHYEQTRIDDMELSIFGFDSEEHTALAGAIEVLIEETIREDYVATELLELGAFEFGGGTARLLARELQINPEEHTLAIGLQTDLIPAEGTEVPLRAELKPGSLMEMRFHVGLLLAASRRMLSDGQIPRRYDENGEPDPAGLYGVTMNSMVGTPPGQHRIDSEFRVWRVAEGYCGFAETAMPLTIDFQRFVAITPGDVRVLAGRGAGAAAAEEDELVEDNEFLIDNFRSALAEELAVTINYDALDMEGSAILFETVAVDVAGDIVVNELNYVVVADE